MKAVSAELVGDGLLSSGNEVEHGLVDRFVQGRRLVVGEHPLPDSVGPLGGVQATVSSAPDTTSTPAENGAPGSRDAGWLGFHVIFSPVQVFK